MPGSDGTDMSALARGCRRGKTMGQVVYHKVIRLLDVQSVTGDMVSLI